MMEHNPVSWKKRRDKKGDNHPRAGTRSNQQIMMEQNPFPEKRKKREEGRQAPEPEPEPGNRTPFPEKRKKKEEGRQAPASEPEPPGTRKSWWYRTPFRRKEKERRRETSTWTKAGTKRNQDIMMEQNPFPEKRKKREEGRQAPEPQPEPGKTTKSLLRKARRK